MIEIPQYYSISGRKITIAVPTKFYVTDWSMDVVGKKVESSKKFQNYNLFEFKTTKSIRHHYIFKTSGNFNIEQLKSQTIILIS